jgi:hypothetical protein
VGWNEPARNTGHTETPCGKDNATFYQHTVRDSIVIVHCVEALGRGTYRVCIGDSGYEAHLYIWVQIDLGARTKVAHWEMIRLYALCGVWDMIDVPESMKR